jgi:hypothetical protein
VLHDFEAELGSESEE